MPQIPDYTAKVGLPTETGEVKVPSGIASDPWESLAKGAAVASTIGFEVSERLNRADQVRQVSESTANASIALNDLRNQWLQSEDFNINPEETFQAYRQRLVDSGKKMAETIPNSQARAVFEDHYRKLAASHVIQGTDDTRRKRLDIIGAGVLRDVDKLHNAAAAAPSDDIFVKNMALLNGSIAGAMASGAITYEHGERMRQQSQESALRSRAQLGLLTNPRELMRKLEDGKGIWKNIPVQERAQLMETAQNRAYTFDQRAKAEAKEQAVNNAYSYAYNTFHLDNPNADFDGAIRWLQNPENAKSMGLQDPLDAAHVTNLIHTQRQHALAAQEQAEKVRVEKITDEFLTLYNQGKLDVGTIEKAKIPVPVKEHWQNNVAAQSRGEERTNPAMYTAIIAAMHEDDPSKRITDFSQIKQYIGVGPGKISGKEAMALRKDLEIALEPPKSAYFAMAKQDFLAKNANDPEMKAMYPQFMNLLSQHVKAEGLKGEQIWTKAQELQKTVEEVRWYHKIIPSLTPKQTWKVELTGKEAVAGTGEYSKNGEPDPIQVRIDHMRAAGMEDAKIAEFLRDPKIGIDPTKYGLK